MRRIAGKGRRRSYILELPDQVVDDDLKQLALDGDIAPPSSSQSLDNAHRVLRWWWCRCETAWPLPEINHSRERSGSLCFDKERRPGQLTITPNKTEITMATMQRLRVYRGPALFSYGFRPFFLFGAIYAGVMVPLWLAVFAGDVSLPSALSPRDWHVHEMLFGYVAAVIAGFLLTAVPNWTGRLPIKGVPLAILFATWLAGRLAVTFSAFTGWQIALVVDAAFLVLLAASAGREIVAGRKWSNLKVVGIISLLAIANIAFHVEARLDGVAEYSTRLGIGLVVTLVCLIGGRIVPSFTRNWLARREPGRLPVPFNRFDAITMAAAAGAVVAWIVAPSGRFTAAALGIAAVLHVVRLARWAGDRTLSDRLVLILHIAYAFVPAGFLLAALAALDLVAPSAGIHAWTGGAIGSMTIAVMTRASLGHTGQALSASVATQFVYALIVVAALARICAALEPGHSAPLLTVAGIAWAAAFLGFAIVYAPLLCRARRL